MARALGNVPVQPGDAVTILGNIVSVAPPLGRQAVVVIQPKAGSPFTTQGVDNNSPATGGGATSYDGQVYGAVSAETSTPGVVQSIVSGVGSIAVITVLLRSGAVVQVPANACFSASQHGDGPSLQ